MRFFTRANSDSYDLILRLATFGQDIAWKHEIIRAVTDRSQILSFACGTRHPIVNASRERQKRDRN